MSDEVLARLLREAQANPGQAGPWLAASGALQRVGRLAEARDAAVRGAAADLRGGVSVLQATGAELHLLPAADGRSALVGCSQDRALALAELPFAPRPDPAVSVERGVAAGFNADHTQVGLADLSAGADSVRWFALPEEELRGHAIAFCQGALYVGTNGERLLVRDLEALDTEWWEAELPGEQFRWGKAIDAMVLDGTRLIAVDNMILPKFTFELDVQDPLRPRFVRTADLTAHYTYEHVLAADMGQTHLGVLSAGGGMGGSYVFLAFYERDRLVESFHVAERLEGHPEGWQGVAMADDLALVAAGHKGLGVVDLAQLADAEPKVRYVSGLIEAGSELLRVKRLGDGRLLLASGLFDDADSPHWKRTPLAVDYSLIPLAAARGS